MKPAVEKGLEQLRKHFIGSEVSIKEDGNGGAYVMVDSVDLGPCYSEETRHTWIGFHLAYNYPIPDIYPHHTRHDLTRADGAALPAGMHGGNNFTGFDRPSVMISRRTTESSSWIDQTAVAKLLKIIEWCGGNIARASDETT